jgi:hypothetical protein
MEEAVLIVMDSNGRVINFAADLNTPRELIESLSRLGYGAHKALSGLAAMVGLGGVGKIDLEVEGLHITVSQQAGRIIVVAHRALREVGGRGGAVAET